MKDECFLLSASALINIRDLNKQVQEIRKGPHDIDLKPIKEIVDTMSKQVDAARDEKYITAEQYVTLSGILRGIKDETPSAEGDYLRLRDLEDEDDYYNLFSSFEKLADFYSMFMIEAVAQCECGTVENRLQPGDKMFREPLNLTPMPFEEEETTDGDEVNENASRN